jgi:hypothetical protein
MKERMKGWMNEGMIDVWTKELTNERKNRGTLSWGIWKCLSWGIWKCLSEVGWEEHRRNSSFLIVSCPITSGNLPWRWQDDIYTRLKLWYSAIWHSLVRLEVRTFRKNILPPSCTLSMVPLLPFAVSPNQRVMCYNKRYYITKHTAVRP